MITPLHICTYVVYGLSKQGENRRNEKKKKKKEKGNHYEIYICLFNRPSTLKNFWIRAWYR